MNLIFGFSEDVDLSTFSARFKDLNTGLTFTVPIVNTTNGPTATFPTSSLTGWLEIFNPADSTLIMRTGDLSSIPPLQGGQWNDFYFVKGPPTNPVTVPSSTVTSGIALPITSGSDKVTSLTITLGTGSITAAGTDEHTIKLFGNPIGTSRVTFTYVFTLVPDTNPDNVSEILDVVTISMSVKSASGGKFGFLVNPIINLILPLLKSTIISKVNAIVQQKVDAVMNSQASSQGIPQGTTITAQSLSITPSGISALVFGAISIENACGTGPSSGSIKLRAKEEMDFLYEIRDKFLAKSPRGAVYINTFYDHSGEMAKIFVLHPHILKKVDELVKIFRKDFAVENLKTAKLTSSTAEKVKYVMKEVGKLASPNLKTVIHATMSDIDEFVGKPAHDILEGSKKLFPKKSKPVSKTKKVAKKKGKR